MKITQEHWLGQSVLVTGHTGFKGGWLSLWLHELGAQVHGYSLDPRPAPSLFDAARVNSILASDIRADLADRRRLAESIERARPKVVFHLAAQPLVRESYRNPLATLASNVMGTAHVLDAARNFDSIKAIVVVTTDKVYENRETAHAYCETDPLGGHDPYSASKAAAEIVTSSYRRSYFTGDQGHSARVATARAGNVIGGGDWAEDRLIPDCLRAFASGKPARVRFPLSVRPWQHVLDPIAGYLLLAQQLLSPEGGEYAKAWNFGPDERCRSTVGEVAGLAARYWGEQATVEPDAGSSHPHEAALLTLDSAFARRALGWKPLWSLEQAVERTVSWQRAWKRGEDMNRVSVDHIRAYLGAAVAHE